MGRMPDGMVNSRKENKIMLEKVKETVAESLNVEESTLSETTSFKEDTWSRFPWIFLRW